MGKKMMAEDPSLLQYKSTLVFHSTETAGRQLPINLARTETYTYGCSDAKSF